MFGKIFLSTQVKLIKVISNKQGIYKLPHELLNNLRLQEIWKYQEDLKTYNYSLVLSLASKIWILSILVKNFWKIEIELFLQGTISHKN